MQPKLLTDFMLNNWPQKHFKRLGLSTVGMQLMLKTML